MLSSAVEDWSLLDFLFLVCAFFTATALFFLRSLSFCFPFVSFLGCGVCPPPSAAALSFSSTAAALGLSNFSNSFSTWAIHRLTPSRFTSLLRTVSTALMSFPMISCRTSNMDMFLGTPLPDMLPSFNCRAESAVNRVVFPHPLRPMRPYLRPEASVKLASLNKSGPPPFRLAKLKLVRCTSAALSLAVVISAISSLASRFSPPPSSSIIMRMASSTARFRSSSSNFSRISFWRAFRRSRSDLARGWFDTSIMLA
mmetsp:Transcript_37866/g.64647  ORF Transcript_37866/g.64647 Transcript_37866/m.64647 type:complete len:255 (+) Transcript_37866:136-900(+)